MVWMDRACVCWTWWFCSTRLKPNTRSLYICLPDSSPPGPNPSHPLRELSDRQTDPFIPRGGAPELQWSCGTDRSLGGGGGLQDSPRPPLLVHNLPGLWRMAAACVMTPTVSIRRSKMNTALSFVILFPYGWRLSSPNMDPTHSSLEEGVTGDDRAF
ncbi:unnamed protein product [Pleuronectes platessa]|uniref:Uncharacterized protein n=1 Tax=Pleuronectes platessa TaxID=8262 RepID=A0A9N7V6H1_PLEPL|nr:unnamed protein product [Pleuronectes platessa]